MIGPIQRDRYGAIVHTCAPKVRGTTAADCWACDAENALHNAAARFGRTGDPADECAARGRLLDVAPRRGMEIYAAAFDAGKRTRLNA